MTIGMMLSLSRDLLRSIAACGTANAGRHGIDLDGKTLGLLGLGAIGRHVARIARSVRMRVVA